MNILGISGSPHEKGNTAFAVKYALNELSKLGFDTEYVSLAGKEINHCIACWKCSKTYSCFIRDDMDMILEALKRCDGLIIGSSVQFGMVSGILKTMMDRCVAMRPNYGDILPLERKIGGAIACAASRNGGQETTIQNIHTFMLQMNMLVISDGPNYCHAGSTIVGEAEKDKWGLETVTNLASNISKMLKNK